MGSFGKASGIDERVEMGVQCEAWGGDAPVVPVLGFLQCDHNEESLSSDHVSLVPLLNAELPGQFLA